MAKPELAPKCHLSLDDFSKPSEEEFLRPEKQGSVGMTVLKATDEQGDVITPKAGVVSPVENIRHVVTAPRNNGAMGDPIPTGCMLQCGHDLRDV